MQKRYFSEVSNVLEYPLSGNDGCTALTNLLQTALQRQRLKRSTGDTRMPTMFICNRNQVGIAI